MAGHVGMIYDKNGARSPVNTKRRIFTLCKAHSIATEKQILLFLVVDKARVCRNAPKSNLLPIRNILKGENCKLQQDNVLIHTFHSTMAYFTKNQVSVTDWQVICQDQNPIENLWKLFARELYTHDRQFPYFQDITQQVQHSWFSLQSHTFQNASPEYA